MTPYECYESSGMCGGGFGGNSTQGYPWAVVNVPLFEGYDPRLREPGPAVSQEPVLMPPAQTMQTMQTTQTTGNQQQAAGGSQQVAGNSLVVPTLIIIAALVFSK